jgi:hypothetical protein
VYVDPDELRRNLEALDSATLQAKLQSGALTKEARAVALAILQARGITSGAEVPPAAPVTKLVRPAPLRTPLPGRTIAKVLFGLYVVFVLLCTFVVFMDPPWVPPRNGTWEGMIGFMASVAAGAPFSFVVLLTQAGHISDAQAVAANFGCVVLNLVLFVLFIRRT